MVGVSERSTPEIKQVFTTPIPKRSGAGDQASFYYAHSEEKRRKFISASHVYYAHFFFMNLLDSETPINE